MRNPRASTRRRSGHAPEGTSATAGVLTAPRTPRSRKNDWTKSHEHWIAGQCFDHHGDRIALGEISARGIAPSTARRSGRPRPSCTTRPRPASTGSSPTRSPRQGECLPRLGDAQRMRELDRVLHDVAPFFEPGRDIDGRIGDEQRPRICRRVDREHMTDPSRRAQTALRVDTHGIRASRGGSRCSCSGPSR